MLRLFDEHQVRPVHSLDGLWTLTVEDGSGRAFPAMVPGIWQSIPQLTLYRGKARYDRTFVTDKEANLLLRFSGVSHTADVFLDGEKLGHHYDAFTGFRCAAHGVKAGTHTLTVYVDDSFSEASTLHLPNDYYTYGASPAPWRWRKSRTPTST